MSLEILRPYWLAPRRPDASIYTARRGKKGVSRCRRGEVPRFEFDLYGRDVGLNVEDLPDPGAGEGF